MLQQSKHGYNELLYAHLLDGDGQRLTYTHFTAKVNWNSMIEITFNRSVKISANRVYRIGMVLNKVTPDNSAIERDPDVIAAGRWAGTRWESAPGGSTARDPSSPSAWDNLTIRSETVSLDQLYSQGTGDTSGLVLLV